MTYISKLDAVDDTLEELGVQKSYKKIHTWSKRMIIILLVYIVVMNGSKMWHFAPSIGIFGAIIVSCVFDHSMHSHILEDLLLITFLWYVYYL